MQNELRGVLSEMENDIILVTEMRPPNLATPHLIEESRSFEELRAKAMNGLKLEREMSKIDIKKIDELRARLKGLEREKKKVSEKNDLLLEKFKQIEQDRGLLLTNIESDRSK